jgi:DNA-binding GntR family transcriptional regulator
LSEISLPINHLDLTEQTYRILRDQILRRQLKTGEKISVEKIALGLGVSRTPVVNALKMLESDGLVDVEPRRGTFITELTAGKIIEMFDVRRLIEMYSAEYVIQNGKAQALYDALKADMKDMQVEISEDNYRDYEKFIAFDRDFHSNLVKIVGNSHLTKIYTELSVHMQVARMHYLDTVEKAHQAQVEHEAILTALKNNDLPGFKKAISDHINNVQTIILEKLKEHGGSL